ncbi:UNVERIFIED_CONTAM: hypothetical protein HDU68_009075 [Siphonaria sp. JEL0065]|nr:hypothetical protein HDU68_009075 [Siphonaria sp. JEL0065]
MIRRPSVNSVAAAHNNSSAGNGQVSPSSPATPKKPRFKPQKADLEILMGSFENNPFPDKEERRRLAERLCLEPKQILFWFQNRRAALKMNGIVVVKPNSNGGAAGSNGFGEGELAPLMEDNGYFFIAAQQQQSDM